MSAASSEQQRAEEVGGVRIIHMVACCGDEGGGLFVCGSPGST